MNKLKMVCLTLTLLLFGAGAIAGPPVAHPAPQEEAMPVIAAPIQFFQDYLSGADGHRCPMTPSCSSYALQAMQRHGAFQGWIMACDRLMRCGRDELKQGPSIMTRHGTRCQDQVQNNDFWLH